MHYLFFLLLLLFINHPVLAIDRQDDAKVYVVKNGLIHYWGFENAKDILKDSIGNSNGHPQNLVTWVPKKHAFTFNNVLHLHGDKVGDSLIMIPYHPDMQTSSFTLDFWFAAGTHAVDPLDHNEPRNPSQPGPLLRWGNIRIDFIPEPDDFSRLMLTIGDVTYETLSMQRFGYYQITLTYNSTEREVGFWLNCINYKALFTIPNYTGAKLKFGGGAFSGRINDIKLYDRVLKGWEITQNGYAEEGLFAKSKKTDKRSIWAAIKITDAP